MVNKKKKMIQGRKHYEKKKCYAISFWSHDRCDGCNISSGDTGKR